MMKAIKAAEQLSSTALTILVDRLLDAHIGQGLDLYWKHHTMVPTEAEYFAMVDGSMFDSCNVDINWTVTDNIPQKRAVCLH